MNDVMFAIYAVKKSDTAWKFSIRHVTNKRNYGQYECFVSIIDNLVKCEPPLFANSKNSENLKILIQTTRDKKIRI